MKDDLDFCRKTESGSGTNPAHPANPVQRFLLPVFPGLRQIRSKLVLETGRNMVHLAQL
jgi:hypothetical protein